MSKECYNFGKANCSSSITKYPQIIYKMTKVRKSSRVDYF